MILGQISLMLDVPNYYEASILLLYRDHLGIENLGPETVADNGVQVGTLTLAGGSVVDPPPAGSASVDASKDRA